MRTCIKCDDEKSEEEFAFRNKKKGTRSTTCKVCQGELSKKHYHDNKARYYSKNKNLMKIKQEFLQDLKSKTPCADCKNKYPHYVMEFDHLRDKVHEVSSLTNNSWGKLMKEIEKCDIVCANCHATRTWMRRNADVVELGKTR